MPTNNAGWYYDNTGDPYDMIENDRGFIYGRGEDLQNRLQNRAGNQQGWEDIWRQYGHQAYVDLMSNPGYTQEQQAGILQSGSMPSPLSQGQIDEMQLTSDERAAISGNPYEARQFYRPDYMTSVAEAGNQRALEGYGSMASGMRGSLNPEALRLSGGFTGQQGGIMDASDAGVRGAITDSLRADPNLAGSLMGDADSADSSVRGTIDAGRLRQDAGFADRYRMTDRDIQNYRDRAARNVGAGNRAALDEIEQRMVQSGNVSPMAYAALRSRLQQNSDVAAADAMTDAELGARSMQADREMNVEANRQDAERGYAGLASGAELALARNRQGARTSAEDLRQQGERTYAGMRSDAEMQMGNRRLGATTDAERMRIGAEQGATDRAMDMERTLGETGINVARDNRNTDLDVGRYNSDTGYRIWSDTDQRASDRARDVAGNRQDVTRYGQATQFGQQQANNDRMSDRNTRIADASRADQQESRGWLTGQQTQASGNVNTANSQMLNLYGTQTGGMQDSSRTMGTYDLGRRGQGFRSNFMGALGSGLGSGLAGVATGGAGRQSARRGW
jgi:hypothetical protein